LLLPDKAQEMKNIYYALCPLPLACLLISFFLPSDSHAATKPPFDWLILAIIGSPILALYGFACIAANHAEGKSVRDPAIATAVAALPILYFLASDFFPK
jgi:hypothetical protein